MGSFCLQCVAELQKPWCGQVEPMGLDEGEAGVSSACGEKGGSLSEKVAKQQVVDALEQAVYLLWNLRCQSSCQLTDC